MGVIYFLKWVKMGGFAYLGIFLKYIPSIFGDIWDIFEDILKDISHERTNRVLNPLKLHRVLKTLVVRFVKKS